MKYNFPGPFLLSGPLWTTALLLSSPPKESPRNEVNNLYFNINENYSLSSFKIKIQVGRKYGLNTNLVFLSQQRVMMGREMGGNIPPVSEAYGWAKRMKSPKNFWKKWPFGSSKSLSLSLFLVKFCVMHLCGQIVLWIRKDWISLCN